MNRISPLLQADFSEDGGYSLIIWGDRELKDADLNTLQMNMLQSNTIPRHIACHVEERDMVIRLFYDISQKKVFKNVLQGHRLKSAELIKILANILEALENAADYMLDGSNYVIESQFIFVGNNPDDIFLVYLPINETGLGSIIDRVRGLALELADYMDEGHKTQLISIADSCETHHPDAYVNQFKNRLNKMDLSSVQPSPKKHQGPMDEPGKYPAGNVPPGHNQGMAPKPQPNQNKPIVAPPPMPVIPPPPGRRAQTQPAKNEPLSERTRIIIGSIGVLAAGYVWKTYMDYPSEGFLYLAIGLTFLIVDAIYVTITFWGSKTAASSAKPAHMVVAPMATPQVRPIHPPAPVDPQQYYNDLSNKTALIGNSAPDTGLLDATQQLGAARDEAPSAYLEKRAGSKIDKISIQMDHFTIGRNSKEVQHVEESNEVSRLHCEIIRTGEGWSIADRDSKNYTYLNGQRLIPNKLYPLTNGDFIMVANIEYTFVTGPGNHA